MDLTPIKCRLCLAFTSEFVEIFEGKLEDLSIASIIKKYFGFEVKEHDSISKVLCNECWSQIEIFHKFCQRINIIQNPISHENTIADDTIVEGDDNEEKLGLTSVKRSALDDKTCGGDSTVLSKKKIKQQMQNEPAVIEKQNKIIRDYIKMECELCSTELDSFQHIQSHFRSEHNTRGYLRCCNRKFTKRYMLVEHIQWHINPDAFKFR